MYNTVATNTGYAANEGPYVGVLTALLTFIELDNIKTGILTPPAGTSTMAVSALSNPGSPWWTHSANIAAKLLKELAGGSVIGPLLVNMSRPIQIAPMTSTASDLVTMAVLASTGVVC